MRRLCLLVACAALAQPVHAIGAQTNADSLTIVTATIHQNSSDARQPVDYETVLFTITRSGRGWIVASEIQLGIS